MADRIIKGDSGNDVVIQNNAGSRKIEVTNSGDVEVTGDFKATTVKATNLKANDGTAALLISDSTGRVQVSEKIQTDDILEKTSGHGVEIDGLKVKDSALVTDTNKYPYVKSGELNSLGYLNKNFFGASYFLSSTKTLTNNTFTEIDGTWSKMVSSGSSGSDDADPFAKFSSGRFTPGVSGFYLVNYTLRIDDVLDDEETLAGVIRRNGSDTNGHFTAFSKLYSPANDKSPCVSGSGIIGLDSDDYLSLFGFQDEGSNRFAIQGFTTISFLFVGTSDL